jgi:hypothetical protein
MPLGQMTRAMSIIKRLRSPVIFTWICCPL